MAFFKKLFGKCLDEEGYTPPEGDGAPATSCHCGKTKILWSHAQPATRYMCFCHDCQQRVDWAESKGGRQTSAEAIDVTLMWNDIIEFQGEENTKWYRLTKPEWAKNGCLDFCVAECCSTVMCGTHPWYGDSLVWTGGPAKKSGIQMKPVWAHFFTNEATPAILEKTKGSADLFVFDGANPDAAKAQLQEIAKKCPKLRAETIQDWKWNEKNINVLGLITGETQCGHLHQAEADQKKKEEQALSKPANNGPLSMIMCCSRGGGRAIK